MVPKVGVEPTRPCGQWFLSSLPSIFQRFCTTTNVHDLATFRIRLGRPRTSASSQQLLANVLNVGGKLRGEFQRGDDGCRWSLLLLVGCLTRWGYGLCFVGMGMSIAVTNLWK